MPAVIRTGYWPDQILLHWVIAARVLFQRVRGGSMTQAIEAAEEEEALST